MNKLFVAFITLFPVLAQAHKEHGHNISENISHVFSSPEHLWPLTLGIILIVVIGVAFNKK
jgi:hypothetical protein